MIESDLDNELIKLGCYAGYLDTATANAYLNRKGYRAVASNETYGLTHHDFHERVYVKDDDYYVINRGTTMKTTWVMGNDNAHTIYGNIPPGAFKIFQLIEKLDTDGTLSKAKTIYLSGHSKGGNEDSWWAVGLEALGYKNYKGVTVNAPSNYEGLQQLRQYKQKKSSGMVVGPGLAEGIVQNIPLPHVEQEISRPGAMIIHKILNMSQQDFDKMVLSMENRMNSYHHNYSILNRYGSKYPAREINLNMPMNWLSSALQNVTNYITILQSKLPDYVPAPLLIPKEAYLGMVVFACLERLVEVHGTDAILALTDLKEELERLSLPAMNETKKESPLLPGEIVINADPQSMVFGFGPTSIRAFTLPCLSNQNAQDKITCTINGKSYQINVNYSSQSVKVSMDVPNSSNYTISGEADWLALAAIVVGGIQYIKKWITQDKKETAIETLMTAYETVAKYKGPRDTAIENPLVQAIAAAEAKIDINHEGRLLVDIMQYAMNSLEGRNILLARTNKLDPNEMLETLNKLLITDYNIFCKEIYQAMITMHTSRVEFLLNRAYSGLPAYLRKPFYDYLYLLKNPDNADISLCQKFIKLLYDQGQQEKSITFLLDRMKVRKAIFTAQEAMMLTDYYLANNQPDKALAYYPLCEQLNPNSILVKSKYATAAGLMGDIELAKSKAQDCLALVERTIKFRPLLPEELVAKDSLTELLAQYEKLDKVVTAKPIVNTSATTSPINNADHNQSTQTAPAASNIDFNSIQLIIEQDHLKISNTKSLRELNAEIANVKQHVASFLQTLEKSGLSGVINLMHQLNGYLVPSQAHGRGWFTVHIPKRQPILALLLQIKNEVSSMHKQQTSALKN